MDAGCSFEFKKTKETKRERKTIEENIKKKVNNFVRWL